MVNMVNIKIYNYKDLKAGSRVKLIYTNDKYTNLTKLDYIGTVESINLCKITGNKSFIQIWVNWDHGSHFAIVPDTGDTWEIIK